MAAPGGLAAPSTTAAKGGSIECAAIIAGGASSRMGTPKALLPHDGRPLIAGVADMLGRLFRRVIVVTGAASVAYAAGVEAVADEFPGQGPAAGIHAALRHMRQPTFCVACDMPFLNPAFIAYLAAQPADYDALLPCVAGRAEPLHAIYGSVCLPVLEAALKQQCVRPVTIMLAACRLRFVDETAARRFDQDLRMFHNWNTPTDVALSNSTLLPH